LQEGFTQRGLEWVPSVANFILVKVGDGARGFAELQKRGVIVRPMKPYGMPEWLRVTVGTDAQNRRLLSAWDEIAAGT
jgi:histidinol-phosphate aminotransferase